jgi:hypothetical protein
VLKGGDTGQSEPATVSHSEYDLFGGRENSVGNAAGEGDKIKHPVGYLKEQPKAGTAGAREVSPGCCFSAPGMTWFPIPLEP